MPSPTYFFMASEVRSGSTYVAELIAYSLNASTGHEVWGLAQEALRDLNDGSTSEEVRTLLTSLWSSPQDFKSSKVMCAQLSILNRHAKVDPELRELAFGERARWVVVRRRNRIRQAVSLAVARQSGVYHSYEPDNASCAVDIDMESVKEALHAVIVSDEYLRLFSSVPARCVELFYEDVVQDPAAAVGKLLRDLGMLPASAEFNFANAKLRPDQAASKEELESEFAEWLLENHHPRDARKNQAGSAA